jgi:hypothetical protein
MKTQTAILVSTVTVHEAVVVSGEHSQLIGRVAKKGLFLQ